MHVGYGAAFQNPNNALSDAEVYRNELRFAEMAEPLGFDSVWSSDRPVRSATAGAKSIATSSISMPKSSLGRSQSLAGKSA